MWVKGWSLVCTHFACNSTIRPLVQCLKEAISAMNLQVDMLQLIFLPIPTAFHSFGAGMLHFIASPLFTSLDFSFGLSQFLLLFLLFPTSPSTRGLCCGGLAGLMGTKPAQINVWSRLTLKIHLVFGGWVWHCLRECQGAVVCVCERWSNHPGLSCYLTLKCPL